MRTFARAFVFFFFVAYTASVAALEDPNYENYVNEIVDSFTKDMQKRYGLTCLASQVHMSQHLEEISVSFSSHNRTQLNDARQLIMQLKEDLVQRVNANKKIRLLLRDRPFTWAEAAISVAFYKPKSKSHYADGSVAFLCSSKQSGNISYERAESQGRPLSHLLNERDRALLSKGSGETEVLVPLLEESCEDTITIVDSIRKLDKKLYEGIAVFPTGHLPNGRWPF